MVRLHKFFSISYIKWIKSELLLQVITTGTTISLLCRMANGLSRFAAAKWMFIFPRHVSVFPFHSPGVWIVSAAARLYFTTANVMFLSILDVWCIYYMVWAIIVALWKVQGQSSQLILSPLAGAAHRSERRRPLISPTSSRCSAREREECKWVHSRKPSPAPSTLKSPLTLPDRDIQTDPSSNFSD